MIDPLNKINKIPKIIHYCWFGGKEKPEIVKKCINSWKTMLPSYEIKEWNETNFDINKNSFTKEAYENNKFAFVSDYVRVYALYNYGGIYLDTDVEVFKPFDDLLHVDSFWGFEQGNYIATSTIGAARKNKLIKEFLDSYEGKHYVKEGGELNQLTNVAIVTEILEKKGLVRDGNLQTLSGLGTFYPQSYFSPYDYINCRKLITSETYTIHYYYKSWLPINERVKSNLKIGLAKIIGGDNVARLRWIISR